MKRPLLVADLGMFVLALGGAGALRLSHAAQPRSEPGRATKALFGALHSKDLQAVRRGATADFYGAFVRRFGEARLARVTQIYDRAAQLAGPRWFEYHRRADELAGNAYAALHEKVNSLGREAFQALSVDERMRLMDDQNKYASFLVERGADRLSPAERKQIPDLGAFRQGQDRDAFVRREGWGLLSADDQKALGGPASLSDTPTSERTAFLDRTGVPLLDAKLRAEISGIERRDLADADAFKLKYGEPLAKAFLAAAAIPEAAPQQPCSFEMEDRQGSLLRGPSSVCQAIVAAQGGRANQPIAVGLRKVGFDWLVDSMQPTVDQVNW